MDRARTALVITTLALGACTGADKKVDPPMVDPLVLVTESLPDGTVDAGYDHRIGATGGTAPYSFSVATGELPPGLMMKAETGQISGMPTLGGTVEFTVGVEDSAGQSDRKDLSIHIVPLPLEVETASLPNGITEMFYDVQFEATGGIEPFTWATTAGALPAGTALGTTGRLSGTPTATGMFDVTVEVTDAAGTTASKMYTFSVSSANPIITGGMLPYARSGDPYDVQLEASGGALPYVWAITGGTLPMGLSMDAMGHITGTSAGEGESRFMVSVTDANSKTDEIELSIFTIGPLVITTRTLPLGLLGDPYSAQLEATGGLTPYRWFVDVNTPLPAGLMLSDEGLLSGTPTEQADTSLRIRIQDATGVLRSAMFSLRVRDLRVYTAGSGEAFPPLCTTSTHVSYRTVDVTVADSFSILDMNVTLDVDYTDSSQAGNSNDKLRVLMFGPDGRQVVFCGNSTGVRGGNGCGGSNGIHATYGALGTPPQRPLNVFYGTNAQGTWRFKVAVVGPSVDANGDCEQAGTINDVTLTMTPDSSSDPYVRVTGFNPNNLLIDPWIRIQGGGIQRDLYLGATMWSVGANGRREAGFGDDVPDARVFTWTATGLPPGTAVTPDGHVTSGGTTSVGLQPILTASDGASVTVTMPLHVVPPDWNPSVREF